MAGRQSTPCLAFYLAATIVALKTEFVQHIADEDPSNILLKQVVETLEEVERLYRRSVVSTTTVQQMAAEVLLYPLAHDLFFPGRLGGLEGVGTTHWSVAVFRVPYRHGCT